MNLSDTAEAIRRITADLRDANDNSRESMIRSDLVDAVDYVESALALLAQDDREAALEECGWALAALQDAITAMRGAADAN